MAATQQVLITRASSARMLGDLPCSADSPVGKLLVTLASSCSIEVLENKASMLSNTIIDPSALVQMAKRHLMLPLGERSA